MNFRFDIIYEYRWMFFYGALITLGLTIVATLGGTILGLFGSLARIVRSEKGSLPLKLLFGFLRSISTLYITFFRGTPLFVQIFIWYYVWFPILVKYDGGLLISGAEANDIRRSYGALIAGALALTFNAGAYITEIFRAGIQSIDKGQMEAARSLGLSYAQAMRFVILPQATRRMLAPLANEFITLLKDSSLTSTIAVAELAYVQKTISGRYSIYAEPLYTIALIYLIMTICLSWFFSWLEKKYSIEGHR
ncbi:MAG: amino acid ABC transporter permease [Neisseria sp.]|uniref:amino acid ABC transporter permease n=1 Tax=Neisseria sp. TaxID=192066 RepID=UPI0026DC0FE3|nr:amino acid ABC transporter permease [Neisseria sp.]MDO4640727.1 amino acid ABC transporter permease [Neisseria sp.]